MRVRILEKISLEQSSQNVDLRTPGVPPPPQKKHGWSSARNRRINKCLVRNTTKKFTAIPGKSRDFLSDNLQH